MEAKHQPKTNKYAIGLPVYFKKIGLTIFLSAVLTMFLGKFFHVSQLTNSPLDYLLKDAILLGLALFAAAKDKIEDEMTVFIKLKAMAGAFMCGVTLTIIRPLLDLLLGDTIEKNFEMDRITGMLLFYIVLSYQLKWAANNTDKY